MLFTIFATFCYLKATIGLLKKQNTVTAEAFTFSVLVPVYIKENPNFLQAALVSILDNQTLPPDEVVIVEDGPLSSDLREVLDKFEKKYPSRIKRFALAENVGMGKAMNHGLKNARFDWIMRMDSDDISLPNRFEQQVNFLKANPSIDVLGTAIEEFKSKPGDLESRRELPFSHEAIIAFMRNRNPINHMTVAFRKNLALLAGGYWNERYFEDYNLWYEMYKAGATFQNLDECLVHVRIGNNMIARRSGYNYFIYEKLLLDKFLRDGFLKPYQYAGILATKFVLRVLPVKILELFYQTFLRKKK
jgi:glycosyltransferase involved in cell wall biosynthesis